MQTPNTPAVFNFDSHTVRTVIIEDQPWFVAADVCAALDLPDTHKALGRLDDDEKGRNSIPTLGGPQEMSIINESGLYNLVLGSRKPEAKRFKKWVTAEVLPAIRKTGRYEAAAGPVTPEQAELLRRIILERFGRRYGSVCGAMHRYFKVPNLSSLPASRFNEAREFILAFPLPPATIPRLKKPALPVAESAPESQNARWVTFFDGHHAPTVLPFHCAGGTDTRWQLIFTRFNGLHVEQLPPRAFFADPATLQKIIQDPAGPIPRTLLPSIIEACVSRLR